LGVLAVLWVLIGPVVAIVIASRADRRARELKRDVDRLTQLLDDALIRLRSAAPAGMVPPATEPAAAAAEPSPAFALDVAGSADETPPLVQPASGAVPPLEPAAATGATAPAPAPRPPSSGPLETLEGKIGGRWSVLVGGLAIALGAIFLVRYSIEQGLLGPPARIALGFLLSAALFATGEWLRRRDRATSAPVFAKADIPAILTAAGGVAAFATIYAAYALYGFIGDAAAFVLLTAAGLVTLLLSVIHGPALAALGALGTYAAPLLVASDTPKPFPVVFHTLAVTAAVLGMARIRGWRWLAIAGVAASLIWGFLTGTIENVNTAAAEMLLLAGLTASYLAALAAGGEPLSLRDRAPNAIALAALAGIAALSLLYVEMSRPVYPPLVSGILLAGALGAAASRWPSISAAALISGVLAVATVMLIDVPGVTSVPTIQVGALEWRVLGAAGIGAFAPKAAAIGLVVGLGGCFSAERFAATAPRSAGNFAAAGAAAPLLILAVVYMRHTPFETRPLVGLAALVMAAVFAVMAERLIARRPADFPAPAPAYYASGAVLALSFAISVGLSTRYIPLALALGAAGVVWVARARPVAVLPWLAALLAGLACLALFRHTRLTPEEIGTTPILNGLILRFGLPAAAVLFAAEMRRRRNDDIPAKILQAVGLALAALFVVLEIRHVSNGGVIAAGAPGLGEQSALTLAALAFSHALQRIGGATGSDVYRAGSLIAGVAGAASIALAHFFAVNPLFTGEDTVSGAILNLLLPGYLLPALAAAFVATAARPVRPRWYVLALAALALLLGFAYVTLMVRHAFQGPRLDGFSMSDAENWTYSAVWLVFGIGLLAAGIFLRSTMVRAASGIVIAAVVCKVFLFDMAALTGALRAASFLGLGAVLIAIGRLYQRLLARPAMTPS
jgi:uncharacterized membrane protein